MKYIKTNENVRESFMFIYLIHRPENAGGII